MLANIKGLIERLDLPSSKGMMPLFEAISNSVDALDVRNSPSSERRLEVRVAFQNDLLTGVDGGGIVDGFDVTDNGIGFTDENLKSFQEAYTLAKAEIGGKGVGRFTFLKVFSNVSIRSVYEKSGSRFQRAFTFSIDSEVTVTQQPTATTEPIGTTLSVRRMDPKYRTSWPREPEVMAQRIVAHFLIRFASRIFPAAYLKVPGHADIDLPKLFQTNVQPHVQEFNVTVDAHQFGVQIFRNKDGRARHDLTFCSHGRGVIEGKLRDLLPELPERLTAGEEDYALKVLVTGEYLDDHANQERTNIIFQSGSFSLDLDPELVKREALNDTLSARLRDVLAADLKATHVEKISQIEEFVRKAPEYRALTSERYRPLLERRVQPGLSDEKLDEALLHIRREIEDEVKKEERDIAALMERESFDEYKTRIQHLMETMNDVGKAKLADYIAHRRTILDLIDNSLKRVQKENTYPFEKVLHKMIFPMGVTSKDIFLEQQNLWLIDERLCFHTLLTSDKKLNSIKGLEGTSGREPDIFAFFYDTPIGVSEPEGTGAVVIIEFKRPGRDDYSEDPASQITNRFREIEEGGVKDVDGRPVNPNGLRYIGYLIADLTPTLRKQMKMRYHEASDGEGFFLTLAGGKGYVEIVSYDKLVKDAKKRNRILFEKLGLHKN